VDTHADAIARTNFHAIGDSDAATHSHAIKHAGPIAYAVAYTARARSRLLPVE
jgi:hypothetical protein